jgi:hypothetical protein
MRHESKTVDILRDVWLARLHQSERAMFAEDYPEAERLFLLVLPTLRHTTPENVLWFKTLAHGRYLYINFLCPRPLRFQDTYERTVPVWEQVLGKDHFFIARWLDLLIPSAEKTDQRISFSRPT